MPIPPGARRAAVLAASPVSRLCGLVALAISAGVLAAWAAKAAGIGGLSHSIYRMNPMTAVCLGLSGLALCLPRRAAPSPGGLARLVLGCVVGAVSAAKLVQLAAGQQAGIDLWLFSPEVASGARQLMAPNTAIAFALLGPSLALAAAPRRWAAPVSQGLAAGALALAAAGLIAYAYGAINLVEFPGPSTMAWHTALGLAAASIGVLWIRPHRGVTGLLNDRTLGGTAARRLLPVIVLTTVGLGGLRVEMARRDMLDEVNGIALLMAAVLFTLVAAVLVLAKHLRDVSLRLLAREAALTRTAADLVAARDAATSAAKARADFIANVSHEIRNPLMVILGYAGRLKEHAGLDARARTEASRLVTAAEALNSVVNDVLEFSRLEAGQVAIRPRMADPAALVTDAASLFDERAALKKLRLSVHLRSGLPSRLLIDADRVRQILLNLIGNAVKFTQEGSVRVVAAYDPTAGRLRIDVEDTGPGLSGEQQALLFRRFSQIENVGTYMTDGSGLGLAICKGLVEAMAGDIGVDAGPGGGSVFHVSLPAPTVTAEASAAERASAPAAPSGLRQS